MKSLIVIALLGFIGANADKIVGGSNAASGEFPSIVYVQKSGSYFCDGSIINSGYILSAAHCKRSNTIGLTIVAGVYKMSESGTEVSVADQIAHPSYNANTYQNDIMILQLSGSLSLNGNIQAVTLALSSPSSGTMCTVAGWGDTTASGLTQSFPNNLQKVDVPVVAKATCNSNAGYGGDILNGMICLGYMSGGQDSCQGDSGGPAYLEGTSTQIGVVSWGYGCAQSGYPGVYTDVAYFRSWINQNS